MKFILYFFFGLYSHLAFGFSAQKIVDCDTADINLLISRAEKANNEGLYPAGEEFAENALSVALDCNNTGSQLTALKLLFNTYYSQSKFEDCLIVLDKYRPMIKEDNPEVLGKMLAYEGFCAYMSEQHFKSRDFYIQSIEVLEKAGIRKGLGPSYNMTGILMTILSDYENAMVFAERSIEFFNSIPDPQRRDLLFLGHAWFNRGVALYYADDFDASIHSYKKADSIYQLYGSVHDLIKTRQRLLQTCIEACTDGDIAALLTEYEALLRSVKEFPDPVYLQLSGLLKSRSGDPTAALEYQESALKLMLGLEESGREVAKQYARIGNAALETGQMKMALNNFDLGLSTLKTGIQDKGDDEDFPEEDNEELWSLPLLLGRAKAFQGLFEENGDEGYLSAALKSYQDATSINQTIRRNLITRSAGFSMIADIDEAYDGAVSTASDLFEISGDSSFLRVAYQYCRESKASDLRDQIRSRDIAASLGVPVKSLSRLKEADSRISYFKKRLENEGNDKNRNFRDSLKDAVLQKNILFQDLKNTYPQIDRILSELGVISLDEMQLLLSKDQLLIEYCECGDQLMIFAVNSTGLHLVKQNLPQNYHQLITDFYRAISDPDFIVNQRREAENIFLLAGKTLYDLWLKDVLDGRETRLFDSSHPHSLLIIPDPMMLRIPFSALPISETEATEELQSQTLVLDSFNISYLYTAELLGETNERTKSQRYKYLGMAPEYPAWMTSKYRLGSLNAPEKELIEFEDELGVKDRHCLLLSGSQANKMAFLNSIGDASLFHFSGHAITEISDPMNSALYFYAEEDEREAHRLSAAEIYSLDLNTELVVLSACETGAGEISRGEGVLSLARAFIGAGSHSALISLWKVPDQATSQLMAFFAEGYGKGMKKQEALRYAQLKYRRAAMESGARSHPYYWAAFVPIGDMAAADFPTQKLNWCWLVLLILIAGSGAIYLVITNRKKRMKA